MQVRNVGKSSLCKCLRSPHASASDHDDLWAIFCMRVKLILCKSIPLRSYPVTQRNARDRLQEVSSRTDQRIHMHCVRMLQQDPGLGQVIVITLPAAATRVPRRNPGSHFL